MAYTIPTATEVKTRFPEFTSVADEVVTLVIAEAARWVDESWVEADYAIAIKLLTAHMLVMDGALTAVGGPSTTHGPLTSMSLGDASESYASPPGNVASAPGDADLMSTSYGRRFVAIRNASQRGPVVV